MSNEAQALTRKMAGSGSFSTSQVVVMMLLADHADEKWSCFPSVELLMHHSQLKERTVRACLKELSNKGVLAIHEQLSQATGAQLANRYVLNKKNMSAYAQEGERKWLTLQAQKNARRAQVRAGKFSPSISTQGFEVDGPVYGVMVSKTPRGANEAPHQLTHDSAPANNAPLPPANDAPHQLPHDSAPANNAPHADGVQETAGWGANDCKNPQVPLKGTRADLTINQESSIDARETEAIAQPYFENEMMIDSQSESKSGHSNSSAEATGEPRLVHRDVVVDHLRPMLPDSMQALTDVQLCQVIDVILNRAGTEVLHKLRYVAKGCQKAPEELLIFVKGNTHSTAGDSTSAESGHVDGFIAECPKHYWSTKNPQAICPSCRTDYLCWSEDDGEPRPKNPQAGDYRTDLRIPVQAATGTDGSGPVELPWGPDDEPDF